VVTILPVASIELLDQALPAANASRQIFS